MSDADTPDDDETDGGPLAVVVADADAGMRLDRLLTARITELSRSRLQALIKTGAVTRDGGTIGDPGARVKPGETYHVAVPPPEDAEPQGEDITLDIVHEDEDLIVINKPPGLVVHPAAGHATGTLVNALIAHCGESLSGVGGVRRPGIVHRLDKDTSGLLVVAKGDQAHRVLSEQFAAHGRDGRLQRRYLALVWGVPQPQRSVIRAALQRSQTNRKKIAVTQSEMGREAVTHYRVAEVFRGQDATPVASLVELHLETGRTHQIRVQKAHIGHPVMGDTSYGAGFKASIGKLSHRAADALAALGRQALHATSLGFEHPRSGKPMNFERPPPDDMGRLMAALRPEIAAKVDVAGIGAKAKPAKSRKRS